MRNAQDYEVSLLGAPLAKAKAALILVHGRGAGTRDYMTMETLAEAIGVPDVAYLLPRALDDEWYEFPYHAPIARNEPARGWTLALVDRLVERILAAGIDRRRIVFCGFSQGACVCLEYATRHRPARYGAIAALSGSIMADALEPDAFSGSLGQTPVFLACGSDDPFLSVHRVHENEAVLKKLQAAVVTRIYPVTGHTVNIDEIRVIRRMVEEAIEAA